MHKFGNFLVGFRYPEQDVTTCVIKDATTDEVLGESTVKRYYKDAPIKRTGRKLALTRAVADAALDRDQRKSIFEGYDAIGALKGSKTQV